MKAGKSKKQERQKALLQLVEENPLLTDEELARRLGVSVQTIRLDRMALGLPPLKERISASGFAFYRWRRDAGRTGGGGRASLL